MFVCAYNRYTFTRTWYFILQRCVCIYHYYIIPYESPAQFVISPDCRRRRSRGMSNGFRDARNRWRTDGRVCRRCMSTYIPMFYHSECDVRTHVWQKSVNAILGLRKRAGKVYHRVIIYRYLRIRLSYVRERWKYTFPS